MDTEGRSTLLNCECVADKLAFLEWKAKEAQRLASKGDSHGCIAVCELIALPILKEDGTLARGDDERELRWQEHFAGVFGRRVQDINKVSEEHESFSAVAYGSQAIPRREAATDPVLVQLMAPSAVEGVVAALQKRKGVGPDGVTSAAAVKLAEIHECVIPKASLDRTADTRHLQAERESSRVRTKNSPYVSLRPWQMRKTGMYLRKYGVQHTVRTGPHGIER